MLFITVRSNSTILKDILKLEKMGNIKLNSSEKLLLINTGTTEQMLQVFSNALTKILILKQTEKNNIIIRTVNIISNDQRVLVSASSIIYLKNLPDNIIYELRKGKKGIGMILLDNKIETYKRITEIGYNSRDSCIYRRYMLLSNKRIISKIIENFSIGIYR
jgi:chorismate-pyruvate lyase